jgi:integral membrane protein (TIGR00529 family)
MLDLAKLAAVLAVIIFLLRLKWNLGLVLLLASALTGLFFGQAALDLASDAVTAVIDPLTLRLIAIVLLITFMGEILRATLQLEGLVRSLTDLVADRRWLLALLPMLIGMLPMVGGAMFSAPMVEEASRDLKVSPEQQTFVNYWFRHALEPVFPLYPSLILAAGLLGVPVQRLTVTQWPLFLATLAGGVSFGLVGLRAGVAREKEPVSRKETWLLLGKSIWPIALVLVLSLLFGVDLIIALALTVAILILANRLGPRRIAALARQMPFGVVPIIAGAMVFRLVLETSGAVATMSAGLANLKIPVLLVVFIAPFAAGLLTGLLTAAFAIGFPIGLSLVGPDPVAAGYGLVAYAGGLAGMLLSPMHLCLSLTRDYYRAEWGGIYRRIVPAIGLLIVAVVAVMAAK